MKNFTGFEILNLSEKEIDEHLIGRRFEFFLNSKVTNIKNKEFIAHIIDLELSSDNEPYSLNIKIDKNDAIYEILILNIIQLKYVC